PMLHHRAHGQDGIEPVTELPREALHDEVGGEPLLPVFAVFVVAHRGVGHDAGVEPGVADVGDARHRVAGARIADLDLVDPGSVWGMTLELVPALDGALLEFLAGADDFELAGHLIDPDWQGQPPEALFGD